MICARHSGVETELRCGKCDTPICPRCSVQTPVGARCPACARVRRSPIYQVGPRHFVYALLAGLAVAFGGAFLLRLFLGFAGFFGFIFYLLYGGLVGEAVSRAANRKRGSILQWIAGGCIVAAHVLQLRYGILFTLAGNPLPLLMLLLFLALAVVSALSRLR